MQIQQEVGRRGGDSVSLDDDVMLNSLSKTGFQINQRSIPFGDASTGFRFDFARAETPEEKAGVFERHFPQGSLVLVPIASGVREFLLKETPDGVWKRIEPENESLKEFATDVMEFVVADLGTIAGAAAVTVLTRGRGIFVRAAMEGVASFVGDIGQELIEREEGVSLKEFDEMLAQGTVKGAFGFGGVLVFDHGLQAISRRVRGGSVFSLRANGGKAVDAFKNLGLTPTLDMVSKNPVIQIMGRQARAISTALRSHVDQLTAGVNSIFIKQADIISDSGVSGQILLDAEAGAQRRIIRQMNTEGGLGVLIDSASGKSVASRGSRSRGNQLLEAFAKYDAESLARVNGAYSIARNIEEPVFSIGGLQNIARRTKTGTPLRKTAPSTTVDTELLDEFGQPINRVEAGIENFKNLELLDSQISDVVDEILNIDPTDLGPVFITPQGRTLSKAEMRKFIADGKDLRQLVAGGELTMVSATDQLLALKQRVSELSVPQIGMPRNQTNRAAAKLSKAFDDVLNNPLNSSPEFVAAWQKASGLASERFRIRELPLVAQAFVSAANNEPATFAARFLDLASASNVDTIDQVIRGLGQPAANSKGMMALKNFILGDLFAKPDQILARLDGADPDYIRKLFNPKQLIEIRKAAADFDRLNQLGLSKAVGQQAQLGRAVGQAIDTGSTQTIETLKTVIKNQGGAESPIGRTIRAGIYNELFERGSKLTSAGRELNASSYSALVKEFEDAGVFDLLTPKDKRFLQDTQIILEIMGDVADAGTSIQANEAVAGLRQLSLNAVKTILENRIVANLLMSKGLFDTFVSGAAAMEPQKVLTFISAAAGNLATDTEFLEDSGQVRILLDNVNSQLPPPTETPVIPIAEGVRGIFE